MSEYQYYEFAAVDRPLDERQLAAVRATSTRAQITPTSFVNEYHWGSFSADPRRMVERFYDAFLYLANWGTRELMFRFPARLVGLDLAQRYCHGDAVSAWTCGAHVVVAALSDEEPDDFVDGPEGRLASILPVRAEVIAGDERALYLLWLLAVQAGEVDDETVEPPVPAGLHTLTGSQAALVEFLRIDPDLVAVAAGAAMTQMAPDVEEFVAGMPATARDALLVGLLRGDDPFLRAETLRGLRSECETGTRTVTELLELADVRRDERERAERERRAQAAAERARRAEQERRDRLAALVVEGEAAWTKIAASIAEKRPAAYEVAVALLVDLREVTDASTFSARLEGLRAEHGRKPALMERLVAAGL